MGNPADCLIIVMVDPVLVESICSSQVIARDRISFSLRRCCLGVLITARLVPLMIGTRNWWSVPTVRLLQPRVKLAVFYQDLSWWFWVDLLPA